MRSAPVVAFWDGEGRPVADPLKGMLLPDFYAAYLESALESARARLAGRRLTLPPGRKLPAELRQINPGPPKAP